MINDARALEPDASLTADVCIVGAGAAGITLALALRGAGLSVCLLEGGGFEISDENQALYKGTRTGIGDWKLDETRARVFGGSTAWWNGWCRPLLRDDFEPHPYLPDGGWPFGYDDLVPYYERSHETLELGAFDYDVASLSAQCNTPLLPFDPNVVESRVYRFSPPTRFGTRYRADLEAAEDIRVYVGANLRAVRLARRGGPVSHLECATLEGGRFTVEASRYVLALGGIENARVLLASNAEQPEGVANGSGRVGLFMEHPHYFGSSVIVWKDAPDLRFYNVQEIDSTLNGEARRVRIVGALGIALPVRTSEELPTFTVTIDQVPLERAGAGAIGPEAAAAVFGRRGAVPTFSKASYRCEQTLTEDCRLTLTSELDALGMPRVNLHWSIRESDTKALHRSFAILAREIGRLGLGRFWDTQLTEGSTFRTSPGAHHMGTTRMSTDPARGVVDANGRAHEVDNLYLTGASVFPTGGDSNPTLTVVAMAHRLADHLRGSGRP